MRRHRRLTGRNTLRVNVAALAIVFAGGAFLAGARGVPAGSAEAAGTSQAARTCRNIQLSAGAYSSNGAAGHIAVIYRLHNLFGTACALYGYPGVQLLDRRFGSLPTTVHRGGGFVGTIPKRMVRLAAHGNAYFTLVYSDVPVGSRPCQAPAAYLMIWAPNDFLPVVAYAANHGAIGSCTGDLDVSPVTANPRFQ